MAESSGLDIEPRGESDWYGASTRHSLSCDYNMFSRQNGPSVSYGDNAPIPGACSALYSSICESYKTRVLKKGKRKYARSSLSPLAKN